MIPTEPDCTSKVSFVKLRKYVFLKVRAVVVDCIVTLSAFPAAEVNVMVFVEFTPEKEVSMVILEYVPLTISKTTGPETPQVFNAFNALAIVV